MSGDKLASDWQGRSGASREGPRDGCDNAWLKSEACMTGLSVCVLVEVCVARTAVCSVCSQQGAS